MNNDLSKLFYIWLIVLCLIPYNRIIQSVFDILKYQNAADNELRLTFRVDVLPCRVPIKIMVDY